MSLTQKPGSVVQQVPKPKMTPHQVPVRVPRRRRSARIRPQLRNDPAWIFQRYIFLTQSIRITGFLAVPSQNCTSIPE
jgi:hypothetical protein